MLNLIITSALIDQLLTALSSTLVYSLLQGVVLAAAGGLVILFTGKARPATRYNLLLGMLVLFTICSAVTFGVQFSKLSSRTIAASVHTSGTMQLPTTGVTVIASGPQQTNYLAQLSAFVGAHHNTIVLVWFLFICIKAIQMAVGLRAVHLLKISGTPPAQRSWQQHMEQMAQQLGIKQQVRLLESAIAKVPMAIGNLKPVILMPIGLLTALSTAEIEAILMHELAHIRRRDYLVNLLQSLVEVVFFFNPAVLWVSQLIKTERENCCDDMALAQTDSKRNYIKALLSCEEYQQNGNTYSMAFSGQKHSLVSRVKRMVSNHNQNLNKLEKTLLAVLLVVSGLCFSAFAKKEAIKKTVNQVVKAIIPQKKEPVPVPVKPVSKVIPPVIAPIKQEPMPLPPDTVKKPVQRSEASEQERYVRKMTLQNSGVLVLPKDTGLRIIPNTTVWNSSAITVSSKFDLKKILTHDSLDRASPEDFAVMPARDWAKVLIDEMVKDGLMSKEKHGPFSISERQLTINGIKQPEEVHRKYWALRNADNAKHGKVDEAEQNRRHAALNIVMIQMAKDKLIFDGDENLSFKLNIDEFVINGQKQPEEIFQKYVNMFVKAAPGGKMEWKYTTQR